MKIRYGMLMVDGVGKAGGQCVQRRGNTRVLRNITIPTQRLASTQNPMRFVNNILFSAFSRLSLNDRTAWITIGNNLSGKTIFGENKNYSGREAYLKCNGVFYPWQKQFVDVQQFTYKAAELSVTNIFLKASASTLDMATININNCEFYQVKALRIRSTSVSPNISKLKTFIRLDDINDSADIYDALLTSVKNIPIGSFWSIGVRGVSLDGLPSPWSQRTVIAN